MNKKGFTLLELMIVVAVIGILAVIAIPAYVGQMTKATRSEAYTNLQNLQLLEAQYYADNSCYYLTGGACTNSTMTGVANIQAFLPGFQPGSGLQSVKCLHHAQLHLARRAGVFHPEQ